jgi:DNA-binding SARP family transcriptional activator
MAMAVLWPGVDIHSVQSFRQDEGAKLVSLVSIRLFGNFSIASESGFPEIPPGKLRDLFCYLLIHHDCVLARELIASAHWPDSTTAQSKRYLRTAFWHLRRQLINLGVASALQVDLAFVRLSTGQQIWLDVAEFERVYVSMGRIPAEHLQSGDLAMIKTAVDLYAGDLLPNLYHDWCLSERERLQNMYLVFLDKLLARCEIDNDYDSGREYGSLLLSCDPLCERTYQRLMRLYNGAGNRAKALAVYEKCVCTLQEHLGIGPSGATLQLHQQIRSET